ncbi:MAG: isopenicillin N synthase family oxygenase [Mycobacterium sp.]|nr:isopenicillin N synthase family oxygenase [Mycobacterium sp.]
MDVAVVDYTAPDAPEQFTESLRGTGFAVLVNHPLRWSLVEQVYSEWAALFDSPAVEKYMMDAAGLTGWFPCDKSETARGHTVRDLKEFFHVYDWSEYPHEVSDAAMTYREIATTVAIRLLDWVQQNTPATVGDNFSMPLSKMLDGSTGTLLRVLRYPPLVGEVPAGAVRAAAHEDINLLTVLPASDEPGLELLGADGQWHPVPCDTGSLVVNAGEMLDLASGGYYRATTHRVVNPTGEAARRPRMALPLFLAPADDVVLAEGRTAHEFFQQRIKELRSQD